MSSVISRTEGGSGREQEGTRNYMGVADPAVDAMISALLAAKDVEHHQAIVRTKLDAIRHVLRELIGAFPGFLHVKGGIAVPEPLVEIFSRRRT